MSSNIPEEWPDDWPMGAIDLIEKGEQRIRELEAENERLREANRTLHQAACELAAAQSANELAACIDSSNSGQIAPKSATESEFMTSAPTNWKPC